MNLNKLFGSQAKVDILKFLTFKRDGVSMRALEAQLDRTFPAIKKQVDSLHIAGIVAINKEGQARSIMIQKDVQPLIKNLLLFAVKKDIQKLLTEYTMIVDERYQGKIFGKNIDQDIIILYKDVDKLQIDEMKNDISKIFNAYCIDRVSMVCMSSKEREKRYRVADRFVLSVMREVRNGSHVSS